MHSGGSAFLFCIYFRLSFDFSLGCQAMHKFMYPKCYKKRKSWTFLFLSRFDSNFAKSSCFWGFSFIFSYNIIIFSFQKYCNSFHALAIFIYKLIKSLQNTNCRNWKEMPAKNAIYFARALVSLQCSVCTKTLLNIKLPRKLSIFCLSNLYCCTQIKLNINNQ